MGYSRTSPRTRLKQEAVICQSTPWGPKVPPNTRPGKAHPRFGPTMTQMLLIGQFQKADPIVGVSLQAGPASLGPQRYGAFGQAMLQNIVDQFDIIFDAQLLPNTRMKGADGFDA